MKAISFSSISEGGVITSQTLRVALLFCLVLTLINCQAKQQCHSECVWEVITPPSDILLNEMAVLCYILYIMPRPPILIDLLLVLLILC